MATPSAILSIVVDANTTEATSKLTQYQRKMDAVNETAKKGIRTQLGASFNDEAFRKYQAATANAARKAADRRAFKAELGANFSPTGFRAYQREVDKAGQATQKAEGHVGRLTESFGKLGAAVVGVGAAFVSYEAAKGAIKDTIELTAATIKLSAITGLDAKEASKWIEIMKVRGVATTAVSMGFITLAKNIKTSEDATKKQGDSVAALQQKQNDQIRTLEATKTSHQKLAAVEKTQGDLLDAARGKTDKATAAFKELGVTQAALTSGNLNEVLLEAADGLSKVENPARRAALAQQLFGRSAKALIPILAEGRQGVEDALAAAERYGAFLPKNAAELKKAHEAQLQLNLAADGLKIAFTQVALPAIVKVAGGVLKFVQQMRDGKGAGGEFASAIKSAFTVVKNAVHFAVDELGGLKTAIEVLVGGYAVSRILKFAGALGGIAKGAGGATGAASAATGIVGKLGTVLRGANWLSFLLPAGIALGAVVDHWIQTSAQAEGKKFADKFLAPMPDAIKQRFEKPIADATNRINSVQTGQRVNRQVAGLGPRAAGVSSDAANQLAAAAAGPNAAIIRAQYFKIGQEAGQATVAGLRSVHDISAPILLQDFLGRLRQLPAQARPEAAKAMISFAAELQAQGKLPVQAVRMIMHNLEAQIPGFSAYLQQQGLASDQALAKTLHFNTATNTLRNTLADYRKKFGDWQISTKITGSNIVQNMATAMQNLHQTVQSSTGRTRRDAIAELKKLHDQATSLFSSMADKTAQAAKDMRGSITSSTSQAAKDAASNLSGLANAVYGGVRSGAINAKQGAQYIQQALNATLKAFGATPIPAATLKDVALSTPFGPNVGAFPKKGVGGGGKPAGAARGGLMQIGQYGQAGRDSVPLNVGGMPVMVAPGEQVAVFNRHQLPIVNQALAPMGGLPGLFSKVRTPNYMAQGGMVPKFAGGGALSYGQLEQLWISAGGPKGVASTAAAIAEAESGGRDVMQQGQPFATTGWGYWQITPGGTQYLDPMTNARAAVAKYTAAGGFSPWTTYNNGAYRAFLSGAGPAALGALASQINAPKVLGGGTIGNLLRAGFGKVADAANAVIGRLALAGGGGGGAFPGAAGGPAGVGSYMGVAMADWVIAALQYAAGKGIRPQPTSGYRPGFDPHTATGVSEHAGTQYPHGAVDFGGFHDPVALANKMAVVAATRSFKWPLLAPIGFVDDGHASGTGHARGGFVPSFAAGGLTDPQKKAGHAQIDAIWKRFRPYFPRGAAEPHVAFPASGISSSNPLYAGLQYAYTRPSEHTSFFMPPFVKWLLDAQSPYHGFAFKNVIHEFAHDFQSRATLGKEWLREGGASAFATELSPFHVDDSIYDAFEARVLKQKGWPWVNQGQFAQARGGLLPFAGSFADGGVVPGPQGKAALAMVHGGEGIVPAFAQGGGIIGRAIQAHPNWLPPNAQKAIANALASALVSSLGGIPSQGIAGQIQLQGFQNQVQAGQNAGNVGGQRAGLTRILQLEQGWLSADRQQLKRINGALRKRGLSKKQRGQLLQDKLALLQEIGTVEADIGSTQTSLNDLSTATDTTGVSGVTDTSAVDAQNALAAAIAAQTQALTDATAAINAQTVYMKLVGEVEKQQAIKALADVISGQIGGQYYSRATGSAGDGSVARY